MLVRDVNQVASGYSHNEESLGMAGPVPRGSVDCLLDRADRVWCIVDADVRFRRSALICYPDGEFSQGSPHIAIWFASHA
jgi:hypothetical protein